MFLQNCFYKKGVYCRDQSLKNNVLKMQYAVSGNYWFLEKEGVIFVSLSVILEVISLSSGSFQNWKFTVRNFISVLVNNCQAKFIKQTINSQRTVLTGYQMAYSAAHYDVASATEGWLYLLD